MGGSSAFAAALRMAISERGVSLSRLHSQLKEDGNPVSMATLSYWLPRAIGIPRERTRSASSRVSRIASGSTGGI